MFLDISWKLRLVFLQVFFQKMKYLNLLLEKYYACIVFLQNNITLGKKSTCCAFQELIMISVSCGRRQ